MNNFESFQEALDNDSEEYMVSLNRWFLLFLNVHYKLLIA
jgi:hypothetical protein